MSEFWTCAKNVSKSVALNGKEVNVYAFLKGYRTSVYDDIIPEVEGGEEYIYCVDMDDTWPIRIADWDGAIVYRRLFHRGPKEYTQMYANLLSFGRIKVLGRGRYEIQPHSDSVEEQSVQTSEPTVTIVEKIQEVPSTDLEELRATIADLKPETLVVEVEKKPEPVKAKVAEVVPEVIEPNPDIEERFGLLELGSFPSGEEISMRAIESMMSA